MKWIPICLTLTLVLSLAACNKTELSADEPAAPTADAPLQTAPVPMVDQSAAPAEPSAESAVDTPDTPPPVPTAELSKTVVKVGQHDITEAQIQEVMDVFLQRSAGRIPPEQLTQALPGIRERIIEELVMHRIMVDAVAQAGITLSEAEFDAIKTELASELPPDMSIEDYMAEIGMSADQLREQMLVRKMVVAKAEAVEKPSEEDIRAFYDENQEGFVQDETVSASHILIKVDEAADDEAAKTAKRERLEGLRQQLLAGADFAELAEAHSDCPSGKNGGDLGSFGRGQMVPEFEDAAFAQPVGSVGEIVTSSFGYHLIKVSAKTDAKAMAFDEVQERISDILYAQQQQDAVSTFVEGLREAAVVERFDAPAEADEVFDLEDDAETPAAEVVEVVEEAVAVEAPAVEAEAAEAADAVEDAAEEAEAAIEETVTDKAAAVEEAVTEETPAVEPEAAEAVEDAAEEAEAAVEETVADNAAEVEEAVAEEAPAVEAEAVDAANAVEDAAEEAVEAVEETSAVETVVETVEAVTEKVEDTLEEAAAAAAPVVEQAVEEAQDVAEHVADGMQEGMKKAMEAPTPAPADEIVPADTP
ncbi:MAG: peptidylprolyl isomerase [Kiritimatiellae bacterium]|nr:peptidylprolyl isomerase [Kiritimatiellia bacterium]